MTTPFPFPTNPQLTGIVIAYANAAMVADRVFPRVNPRLTVREFKYSKFAFGQTITIPDTRVGRKGTPNEIEFQATEATGSVDDYGLDDLIPQEDINLAPAGYDPRAQSAQTCMDLVLLDREKRCADRAFNPDTYGSANKVTLSGTSQWSNSASDPLVQLQDASDSMVMKPNKLLLGKPVATQLRRHPAIVKALSGSGTDKGVVSLQALAELLELDEIIVGEAWGNYARRGQAMQQYRLWGKHALLFRSDALATSTLQGRPTFGWTAQYLDRVAGDIPEPKIGLRGGVRVRAGESVAEVIAAPDLGYFFQNAVQ